MFTEPNSKARQDVVLARVSFIEDTPIFALEKPYMSLLPDDGTFPPTNCSFSSRRSTPIVDKRRTLSQLSLEENGFVIVPHPLRFRALATAIGEPHPPDHLLEYLHEVTDLVKAHLGAEKAICIDWRVCD